MALYDTQAFETMVLTVILLKAPLNERVQLLEEGINQCSREPLTRCDNSNPKSLTANSCYTMILEDSKNI